MESEWCDFFGRFLCSHGMTSFCILINFIIWRRCSFICNYWSTKRAYCVCNRGFLLCCFKKKQYEDCNSLCAAEVVTYICLSGEWTDTDKVPQVLLGIQCRYPQLSDTGVPWYTILKPSTVRHRCSLVQYRHPQLTETCVP